MSYSPKWLRFLATHALEIREDGAIPSHLYAEFEHLGPGRICSCYTTQLAAETAHQSGVFESRMPGATWLDFQRAYEALPMDSRGRTHVYLMLLGSTEQDIYDATEANPQWLPGQHRQRIRSEMLRPGRQKAPQPVVPARGWSVWETMARFLNREG